MAAAAVAVLIQGALATVEGGNVTRIDLSTPADWCDYYGVEADGSAVVLFKAVGDDWTSPHGFGYPPGVGDLCAPDWDGGERECGGGLHFSPSPSHAKAFFPEARRFVACRVPLADIAVYPDGDYPEKVKARCCIERWEVDIDGNRIGGGS